MRDGVDETVMLFIAADFPDQESCVQDESGDDSTEENDSQEDTYSLAPIEDDPAKTDCYGDRRQTHAQRKKENDGSPAAGNAHGWILPRCDQDGL